MPRDDAGARCSVEGCRTATVVSSIGLFCEEHASGRFRCDVDGYDCWADLAIDGRPLCRHHAVELRQSGGAVRHR